MGILDRFRGGKASDKKTTGNTFMPYNVKAWNFVPFKGDIVEINLILACIDALSRNIAKMELQAVRIDQNGIKQSTSRNDINAVLQHPNPYMTMYDFLYKVSANLLANDNAYIYPEYDDGGNLIALYPINYRSMRLYQMDDGTLICTFMMNYFREYTIPYREIIHLRNHFIRDEFVGEGNASLKPVSELLNAQDQGIIKGIANSAIIRGILKSVSVIKESDLKKARDQFVEDNLSVANAGGVIALDGKFDYQNIESKPYVVDADTMKVAESKVYSYFGVNEDFLQNKFSSAGYEAVYEGRLEPFAIQMTQALTYTLLTARERGFGNRIEANMRKVKYQPISAVTNVINATRELGLFTRNEYREMLGYAPLSDEQGGNEIMIAVNNYSSNEDNQEGDSNERKD